ncbi:MAG: carbamoyl phosphate synthase large subunit, partial [Verrucomicrobiae bacterium]|nr:carbamoyl phosphate synthase large subunit [Verrucomicrobiae bacterium]
IILGPEMRSTGEVMGIDEDFGIAYAKSQMAAQPPLPLAGKAFVSVKDSDKEAVAPIAAELARLGFEIFATGGTAAFLEKSGVRVNKLFKLSEGRPNILDLLKNDEITFIINTPSGPIAREDEVRIRNTAFLKRIPIMTTLSAARASVRGIASLQKKGYTVNNIQSYHKKQPTA